MLGCSLRSSLPLDLSSPSGCAGTLITRQSLGYSYVNFTQHADAERPLEMDELRPGQGEANEDHVEPEGPFPEEEWSGERFHQELGRLDRQQGHVRHFFCIR